VELPKAWPPAIREPGFVDLTTLQYDRNGLLLTLTPFEGAQSVQPVGSLRWERVEILFQLPRAFREIDEGYRITQLWSLEDEPLAWIYLVDQSSFLQDLLRISEGVLNGIDLVHWLVPSANSWVDVISECEPTLKTISLDAA